MRYWITAMMMGFCLTSSGWAQQQHELKTFTATRVTVTRQGPTTDFERLTPLVPGAQVVVREHSGDWYRSIGSGAWIDSRTGSLSQGAAAPPRLQNATLDSFANGDARLTLSCTVRPEIQALHRPATGQLSFTLASTDNQIFELVKPTGHAPFLESVIVRPDRNDTVIEVFTQPHALGGYAIEPGNREGEIVICLRKPVPKAWNDLIITLDAGHGGPSDSGTVGHAGLAEKVLNLRVAEALAAKLRAKGATVVMTRIDDSDVAPDDQGATAELQARVDVSVSQQAHLFLSLHHNARPSVEEGKISHGTDIYYYHPLSEKFAQAMAAPIADAVGEPLRTSRYRSFHVIRQSYSPALLLEFQYLSNPTLEKTVLDRPDYPDRAAEGVIEGLQAYLAPLP